MVCRVRLDPPKPSQMPPGVSLDTFFIQGRAFIFRQFLCMSGPYRPFFVRGSPVHPWIIQADPIELVLNLANGGWCFHVISLFIDGFMG